MYRIHGRPRRSSVAIGAAVALLARAAGLAHAGTKCDGPDRECGAIEDIKTPSPIAVSVGLAIEGIHNLHERTGGWDLLAAIAFQYAKSIPPRSRLPHVGEPRVPPTRSPPGRDRPKWSPR